jgi:aspartyl-tRNA(Asn)/glutamyl-tRNA(Gln) amidotransferase subunit B
MRKIYKKVYQMFETVIGLEVHVQLNTKTKLFCSCPTSFAEHQNSNTCPTCLALPGALPVVNREAVIKAMRFGYAINADVNHISRFDRKSYFYPDSPSAYQITQLYKAIVQNGEVFIDLKNGTQKRIGVIQAHLEADAGKNIHDGSQSKIDLNRAGTPLLEIVSEPDMRSADEAVAYLKKLHSTVRYLDISDANMQEGSFRCDVNVSVKPQGQQKLGTRVEIKNINSFKFVASAINYEVQRHIEAYEDGVYEDEISQETRLWDVDKGITKSMRGKEEAADYRYFPDPDLRPLVVTDEMISQAKEMPELPDAKIDRYIKELGLKRYDASVICATKESANFFEEMLKEGASAKTAVNWLNTELLGRLNKRGYTIVNSPVSASKLGELVSKIDNGIINGKGAKDILDILMKKDVDITKLIDSMGLAQISDDGVILEIIDSILDKNQDKVEQYRAGKIKLLGFFVGQIMKASRGSANPKRVHQLLKERLLNYAFDS